MNCFRVFTAVGFALLSQQASVAQTADLHRLQAFAQGGANNCVPVALIKAAIQRFGVGQVFDTLRTTTAVRVTLRDQTVLTLTDAERRQAAAWARFKYPGNDEVALPAAEQAALASYAVFCYAVMAKYIETQNLYGCTNEQSGQPEVRPALGDYSRALRRLTRKGICSDNAYRHLGLRTSDATNGGQDYRPDQNFSEQVGMVAYSNKHAVFVLGQLYDNHGRWQPLAPQIKAEKGTFKPKWYFVLE